MEGSWLERMAESAFSGGAGLLVFGWLVLCSGTLLHSQPQSKRALRDLWLLFAASLALSALTWGLQSSGAANEASRFVDEIAVLIAGVVVVRVSTMLAFQLALPRFGVAPPRIVEDLVSIALYIAFVIVRMRYAGLELSQIITTSAVLTGIVAFSMQDTLGNVLGGLALQLDDSLRIGDWIKLGDINGKVTEIRWRSTEIETRNWETIVVPNSVLMRGEFVVLGRRRDKDEQWRRWIWFQVGYETTPAEVIRVVNDAIRRADIPNVAKDPTPNCVMMDFERLCGRYALRYWLTDLAVDDPTDSEVRCHVYAALERHGIDPFVPESFRSVRDPARDDTMDSEEQEIRRRVAILENIALFAPLTSAERRTLAPKLLATPFLNGDRMTRQGDEAHWLYIVVSGRAEVVLEKAGRQQHVGWIEGGEDGSYFGEMGLMTGAPRSATVIARTDVNCLRLEKKDFALIVQQRPELASLICAVMETRAVGIADGIGQLEAQVAQTRAPGDQPELLQRIRQFFNV